MEFLIKRKQEKRGAPRVLVRPDWTTLDHQSVRREIEESVKAIRVHVETASAPKQSFHGLVVETEERMSRLEVLYACMQNLNEAMHTTEVEAFVTQVSELYLATNQYVWTHAGFYRAHRSFRLTQAYKKLGEEEKTAFTCQIGKFKSNGFFLPESKKRRIAKYEAELEQLEVRFKFNIAQSQSYPVFVVASVEQLGGINDDVISSMKDEAVSRGIDGWVALPSMDHRLPILAHAHYRPLRESLYRAYETIASDIGPGGSAYDNRPIAERILLLRERLAKVNGYMSCASHTIGDHMSGTPKAVRRFLNSMVGPVVRVASADFARLDRFCKSEFGHDLRPWDLEYVRNRYIEKVYGYTGDDLREFLTLDASLEVLFMLIKEQYGCNIVEIKDAKSWHPSVRFFEVYEHSGQLLGGFYLDAYTRTGDVKKPGEHFWTRALVSPRRMISGDIVVPLCVVHMKFLGEENPKITRLSHMELATLFHEFGHALEMLFDRASFLSTGIENREYDVVEVASMFMENWAWDIEVLARIVAVRTKGKQLPLRVFLAIHRQRSLIQSIGRYSVLEYLKHGLIDLELHSCPARRGVIDRVVNEVNAKLKITQRLRTREDRYPNNYSLYFTAGYIASTYSYLWSWKFAAAIRAVHLRGPHSMDSIVSRRFRREYIEAACTKPSSACLRAFFGTNLPSTKALLEYTRML